MVVRTGAHPPVNGEQQFRRAAVGAMNGEAPAELFGFGAQCGAVIGDERLIVGAPKLGAPGGDAAEPFGLDKLDAAGIGEAFLRGIDDLHDMAARAIRGELADGAAKLRDRAPQVRIPAALPKMGRRKIRRQARALAGVMQRSPAPFSR